MKKLLFSLTLFLFLFTNAQTEFIINGNFEAGSVPTGTGQIESADNWFNGLEPNPDLYDAKSSAASQVNLPARGYVYPNNNGETNNRFIGLWGPNLTPQEDVKEFAMTPLSTPITQTGTYVLSLKVSRDGAINFDPEFRQLKATLYSSTSNNPGAFKDFPINFDIPILNETPGNNWIELYATVDINSIDVGYALDYLELCVQNNWTNFNVFGDLSMGYVYIDDVSLQKVECPNRLALSIDCTSKMISIDNLPIGATVNHTTWYYRKKVTGSSYIIANDDGLISSVQAVNNGYYTVSIQFTLLDGTICSLSQVIFFSEENCCEDEGFVAWYDTEGATPFTATEACTISGSGFCRDKIRIKGGSCMGEYYQLTFWDFDLNSSCTASPQHVWSTYIQSIPGQLTIDLSNQLPEGYYMMEFATGDNPNGGPTWDYNYDFVWVKDCVNSRNANETRSGQHMQEESLHVYPNPAKNTLTIDLGQEVKDGTLTVYSPDGKVLMTNPIVNSKNIQLNIEELGRGLYLLKVKLEGRITTKRFIKE